VAFLTRSCTYLLAIICLFGGAEIARAESRLPRAQVVWAREGLIYIATKDSAALEPGTILTFKDRGRKVAAGEVTAVYNGELIAAVLTSGSLKKVKNLDRVAITAEPPVFHAPPVLRLGYPAPGRKNLLFDCSNQSLEASILQGAYRADTTGGMLYRLVRDSTNMAGAAWPDTLLVRLFDEVSDEEIALERGDLDAAVFWPGEASAHIRDVMRWQGRPSGLWRHAILTASGWHPGVAIDSAKIRTDEWRALALLNQEIFRGDLTRWIDEVKRGTDTATAPVEAPPPPSTVSARFEVDASFPGRGSIERFLNRAMGSSATPGAGRVVRLRIVDFPPEAFVMRTPQANVFTIRCPVMRAQTLRAYLDAIGVDPLVNLFDCKPPEQKP